MAPIEVAAGVELVDADVHVAPPAIDQLEPHLEEMWREYLRESGFRLPTAVRHTYPDWSPAVRISPASTSLSEIAANVLGEGRRLAILHCAYGLECIRHPYLAAALAAALNDYVRREWLDREPRLFAAIAVPPQHAEIAAAEVRRCGADMRYAAVSLPARSWEPYGNARYSALWQAAADLDLPVLIHFGGLTGTQPTGAGWVDSYVEEYVAAAQLFQAHICSLVAEGVFDRHPSLRIVMTESGVSWLPALLWRMDRDWKTLQREVPWLKEPPSAYVRRHLRLTVQPADLPPGERAVRDLLDQIGSDEMLMYSSDHPHPADETWPRLLAAMTPEEARRTRVTNAWETFGLARRVAAADG
jgi:uncharacterized protein